MPGSGKIWGTVLGIAAIAAIVLVQSSVEYRHDPETNPELDMYYVPHPEYIRMVSLGFEAVAADIYWIKTVLYFGKRSTDDDFEYMGYELRNDDKSNPAYLKWRKDASYRYRYLYDMLNIVTDLDPYFMLPYTFGGLFLSMKNGRPDLSIKLLEKGRKYRNDSWMIPFYLGFNYYFYLDEPMKAVDYFIEAGQHPDVPRQIVSLTNSILIQAGKRDVAIDFITGVRNRAADRGMKEEMEKLLDKLHHTPAGQDTVRVPDINAR